jgi:hypothetical protein
LGVNEITPFSASPYANPDFLPDLSAGVEGTAASHNLILPCKAGLTWKPPFVGCTDPGRSAWTVGFCGPGTIKLKVSITPLAAGLTIFDLLSDEEAHLGALMPISLAIVAIPDLKEAVNCLGRANFACTQRALRDLLNNDEEIHQLGLLFEGFGFSSGFEFSLKAGLKALLKDPTQLLQLTVDAAKLLANTLPLGVIQMTVHGYNP